MQLGQQHVGNVDVPRVVRSLSATHTPKGVPLKGGTPPGPGAPFARTFTIIHRNYVPGSSTLITPPTVHTQTSSSSMSHHVHVHVPYLFTLFSFVASTLDEHAHGLPPLSSHILPRPLSAFHHVTVPRIFTPRDYHPPTPVPHAACRAINTLVWSVIAAAAVYKFPDICSNYRSPTRLNVSRHGGSRWVERVSRDTCANFNDRKKNSGNTCR